MIYVKIIGCVVTVFFSACLGIYYANSENERLRACEEIYSLVSKLEWGTAKRIPVNEIIAEYISFVKPKYITGKNKEELLDCLCRAEKYGACAMPASLCTELLRQIGKSTDGAEIQRNCTKTAERIDAVLLRMREECKGKRELYLKLGIILGSLVCVTLV